MSTAAITHALRIRRLLLQGRRGKRRVGADREDLGGLCGLASIMLCERLGSVASLRLNDVHAWNVVDGVIIDITATQFYDERGANDISCWRGVLVTPRRQTYHKEIEARGGAVIREICEEGWYDNSNHHVLPEEVVRWKRLYRRFACRYT